MPGRLAQQEIERSLLDSPRPAFVRPLHFHRIGVIPVHDQRRRRVNPMQALLRRLSAADQHDCVRRRHRDFEAEARSGPRPIRRLISPANARAAVRTGHGQGSPRSCQAWPRVAAICRRRATARRRGCSNSTHRGHRREWRSHKYGATGMRRGAGSPACTALGAARSTAAASRRSNTSSIGHGATHFEESGRFAGWEEGNRRLQYYATNPDRFARAHAEIVQVYDFSLSILRLFRQSGSRPRQSSMPSCSLAASDMRAGVQGGSQTTSTLTDVTFSSGTIRRCTSPGSVPATGQPGEVSVMLTCDRAVRRDRDVVDQA